MNNSAPDPQAKALAERVDHLQKELAGEASSIRIGATLVMIVGVLLIGLLSFYFWYGYKEIKPMTEPELLVNLVDSVVDRYVPVARNRIETEVKTNAKAWAKSTSDTFVQSFPEARKHLQRYMIDQIETSFARGKEEAANHFEQFIKGHKKELKDGFDSFTAGPEQSKKFVETLKGMVEQDLGRDLNSITGDLFDTLAALNKKVTTLKVGNKLSNRESLERELISLLRYLLKHPEEIQQR